MKKINVRVLPRSSRSEVVGQMADGTLKVKLTVAPVDGKANETLITLLAEHFDIKKSQVSIASGERSRNKVVVLT